MLNRRTLIGAALWLCPAAALAADPDAQEIITKVDSFRLPARPDAGVKLTLRTIDGVGANRIITHATVLSRGVDALVLLTDGDQRGMKVLSTAQGFWIYAPNTRRAMRLTPLQMVRGQTNAGDIARLRFATDYEAAFAPEKSVLVDGQDCWVLTLKAKSGAATYASVILRASKKTGAPLDADLFVASGKKLKSVQFGPVVALDGRPLIAVMTYIDGTDPAKRTATELLSISGSNAPVGMFKPEALPTDF
jgi:hypothetical protein